jgi:hypothetical protein
MKSKNINYKKAFAYFAPDGNCQVRTISPYKDICREMLPHKYGSKTWQDYEAAGFYLKRIMVNISVLED